jgi:hypothetical protein
MNKIYTQPEIEIVLFKEEDILGGNADTWWY